MKLLIDGVKYELWTPRNEDKELAPLIVKHSKEIFGESSIYFDIKKEIKSKTGEKTIPDGFLIDLDKNEFYLIEVELSTHHEYDHISKQMGKFIKALKNYKTRQQIASILKEYVEEDVVRKKLVTDKIGKKDIYQYCLEEILEQVQDQNFQVIVVIDKKTDKIEEACGVLNPRPKIIEFKTFRREGAETVQAYLFEPITPIKVEKAVPKKGGWSLEVEEELSDEEIQKRINSDITQKTRIAELLRVFVNCLLKNKEKSTSREVIKKALIEAKISNSDRQAGTHLSNISQFITRKNNSHWRQILEFKFEGDIGQPGARKDNYRIKSRYFDIMRRIDLSYW